MKKTINKTFHRIKNHPNQWVRKGSAIALMIGGVLGFLPVLGFWMLPLGLVLFFSDSPAYWRLRRRFVAWRIKRRQDKEMQKKNSGQNTD